MFNYVYLDFRTNRDLYMLKYKFIIISRIHVEFAVEVEMLERSSRKKEATVKKSELELWNHLCERLT